MTKLEAKMINEQLDFALSGLSHALEEPLSAETYVQIAMNELEFCRHYVMERLALQLRAEQSLPVSRI